MDSNESSVNRNVRTYLRFKHMVSVSFRGFMFGSFPDSSALSCNHFSLILLGWDFLSMVVGLLEIRSNLNGSTFPDRMPCFQDPIIEYHIQMTAALRIISTSKESKLDVI